MSWVRVRRLAARAAPSGGRPSGPYLGGDVDQHEDGHDEAAGLKRPKIQIQVQPHARGDQHAERHQKRRDLGRCAGHRVSGAGLRRAGMGLEQPIAASSSEEAGPLRAPACVDDPSAMPKERSSLLWRANINADACSDALPCPRTDSPRPAGAFGCHPRGRSHKLARHLQKARPRGGRYFKNCRGRPPCYRTRPSAASAGF